MKDGRWVPISKSFIRELPKDRPYTKLEAAFSLQIDYDRGNEISVTGLASLWRWSRKKVVNFFREIGVKVEYQENTSTYRNQRGLIRVLKRDYSGTNRELIRFIDSSNLHGQKDIKGANKGLFG